MARTSSRIAESMQTPHVRQFSVFLQNKVGALLELTRRLGEANVHICGISVIDNADSAVVRMVVDDPESCREVLNDLQMAASESDLIVVELPHGPEKLAEVLRYLVAAEVNILHTYSLMIRPHDKALLALHCEDSDFAREVLAKAQIALITQKDISR